jgi:signal transduction histidine kinase
LFFAILNIISISSDIISEIIIDKEKHFIYNSIDFINNFVSLLISIILIIFSLMIWNIVEIQSNLLISFDDEINEIYSRNKKYLSTRKIQIIIISFGNFFTDLFEIIILFLKKITFRRKISYNKIENKINLFDILVSYSLWINTFLNFIAII